MKPLPRVVDKWAGDSKIWKRKIAISTSLRKWAFHHHIDGLYWATGRFLQPLNGRLHYSTLKEARKPLWISNICWKGCNSKEFPLKSILCHVFQGSSTTTIAPKAPTSPATVTGTGLSSGVPPAAPARPGLTNAFVDMHPRPTSNRPQCNSVLHLFGKWLFDASLASCKFEPLEREGKILTCYWFCTKKKLIKCDWIFEFAVFDWLFEWF